MSPCLEHEKELWNAIYRTKLFFMVIYVYIGVFSNKENLYLIKGTRESNVFCIDRYNQWSRKECLFMKIYL